jgi:acyl-coenzyme A synthetase/AMP-(fatty) acid ligase
VERVAALLLSKARIKAGDTVAVVYPPGTDLIVAVFACLYIGKSQRQLLTDSCVIIFSYSILKKNI